MTGKELEAFGDLGRAVGAACHDIRTNGDTDNADGLEDKWGDYTAVVGQRANRPDRPDAEAAALRLLLAGERLRHQHFTAGPAGEDADALVGEWDAAATAAERLLGLVSLTPAGEG